MLGEILESGRQRMHRTTRQERLSDVSRAQQLRGKLKDEGRQTGRVIVVTDRMRMQLMQAGLPYKRGDASTTPMSCFQRWGIYYTGWPCMMLPK